MKNAPFHFKKSPGGLLINTPIYWQRIAHEKSFLNLTLVAKILSFSKVANVAFYNRGGGPIYNDVLNVAWLQNDSCV